MYASYVAIASGFLISLIIYLVLMEYYSDAENWLVGWLFYAEVSLFFSLQ